MSSKKNESQPTGKVMTKYDQKLERRKAQEAQAKKEKLTSNLIMALMVVLFAGFVAYFPINNYLSVNGAYVTIGGEAVNRAEFDYNYGLAKASYLNNNGYMLSMFGMDVSTIESQYYSEDLTFAQYFEQLTVENMKANIALEKQAQAEGFEYDVTADYEEMIAGIENAATEAGLTTKKFLQDNYGSLATVERLEKTMKQSLYAAAFYDAKAKELVPDADQITAHYNENKNTYDSVDYHMTTVDAQLPTTNPDGSVPVDEEGNEVAYVPTEEEKAVAMEAAKKQAEALEATIATEGEEYIAVLRSSITSDVAEFLFSEETQIGDTAVLEDTITNSYYVVSLDNRYRNEEPTKDVRVVITSQITGDEFMALWNEQGATEEAFIELAKQYDENGMGDYGCLFEGVDPAGMDEEMSAWLLGDRANGDTTVITDEEGLAYVLYYIGENEPVWYLTAKNTLTSKALEEYLTSLTDSMTVEENKASLAYLKIESSEEE